MSIVILNSRIENKKLELKLKLKTSEFKYQISCSNKNI
jgi:hypothetical protein